MTGRSGLPPLLPPGVIQVRYLREGIVRTWLRHTALITLYYAGVSPHHLARRQPSRECGSRARSFTCSFSMIPTQPRRLRMKQR